MADAADARRRAEEALAEYDRLWGAAHATNAYGSAVVGLASALRAILAAGPEAGAGGLDALAIEINEWAAVTFPFRTAASVAEHLRREAHELAEAPLDPEEMADVFILLANLWKFTGVDLPCAVAAKLAKNRARKWGKPDAQGVVEHVREGPQALAAGAATPPPPSDAVREAADVLAEWDEEEVRRASPSVRRLVRALSALAVKPSAQPAGDAVREAAEALTVYCHVCEADRREPCVTVTTGDPAPYPHPERAVAAALAARGGE